MHLAMWSGPRNISTAMMRAWESRGDTFVVDEPFYACYLQQTKLPHPLAEEIIARYETDLRKVVEQLTGEAPGGQAIYYQKLMTHHLLPEIDRDWIAGLTNCFLIRDPREMLPSYLKKNGTPTLADTGYPQQRELFELVRSSGRTPPVLDSKDVLKDPPKMLRQLCEALGLDYSDKMLSWQPGVHEQDGLWADHWYGEVLKTTGFQPYRPKNEPVPNELGDVFDECNQIYEELYKHRLT